MTPTYAQGRPLAAMKPADNWNGEDYEAAIRALADDELQFRVWGADWCPDCTEQLPALSAAFVAAGVPDERVTVYPVERTDDGKDGEEMAAYDVDRIPTVVVERDGRERARFVERSALSIPAYLASELRGDETGID